jgi:hypothetical protein
VIHTWVFCVNSVLQLAVGWYCGYRTAHRREVSKMQHAMLARARQLLDEADAIRAKAVEGVRSDNDLTYDDLVSRLTELQLAEKLGDQADAIIAALSGRDI